MQFMFNIIGAAFRVHLNLLLPLRLQRKLAERRVLRTVRHAYHNVPYYRKKYDEAGVDINSIRSLDDLKLLPSITKDEIRNEYPHGIVAKGVDIDRCHYSATTGSTGKSLPFLYSMRTFAFYIATGVRMYTMIGYRPWHKISYIKYTKINYPRVGPFFRTYHIPSTITVQEQIRMLRESSPDLIIGYASIVFEIAQRVTKEDLKAIQPKFIGVNSELSSQEQRDFIGSVFGCPVYDEYSTEETWMIASQCRKKKYHLFTDNIWVEFLDEDGNDVKPGQTGEIFLTTTRSPVMPFIRYRIGDLGRYAAGPCNCSIGFPVLEAFEGRADDSFILPSGKYVSSLKILNTFTMYIKKYLHLMEEFKVVQTKRDTIVIKLVKGRDYKEENFKELIGRLHQIMGEPITITVEFLKEIDSSGSIKRKAIESLVGRSSESEKVVAAV